MSKKVQTDEMTTDAGASFLHVGPPLEKGALPSLFYFALSAKDSLTLDPFNQIVQFLANEPFRIFSVTLPAHENNLSPINAMNVWAELTQKGEDFISKFVLSAKDVIDTVIKRNLSTKKIAAAGLSRGGFMASHLASQDPRVKSLLSFAPLVDLSYTKEFELLKDHPYVQKTKLSNLKDMLYDRKIRFYIGNRDRRVGTDQSFKTLTAFVEKAFENKIRTSEIELYVTPSIGHMGHGTSSEIFEQGAKWIQKQLL